MQITRALPRVAGVCQNTTPLFASIHYAALRARRPWWRRGEGRVRVKSQRRHVVPSCGCSTLHPYRRGERRVLTHPLNAPYSYAWGLMPEKQRQPNFPKTRPTPESTQIARVYLTGGDITHITTYITQRVLCSDTVAKTSYRKIGAQ